MKSHRQTFAETVYASIDVLEASLATLAQTELPRRDKDAAERMATRVMHGIELVSQRAHLFYEYYDALLAGPEPSPPRPKNVRSLRPELHPSKPSTRKGSGRVLPFRRHS